MHVTRARTYVDRHPIETSDKVSKRLLDRTGSSESSQRESAHFSVPQRDVTMRHHLRLIWAEIEVLRQGEKQV